jgi:hypothetical protein
MCERWVEITSTDYIDSADLSSPFESAKQTPAAASDSQLDGGAYEMTSGIQMKT